MGTNKILWAILVVYLTISTAVVSGAAVETTTETLTQENDIRTEEIPEIEPYTTTSNNECICNCENQIPVVKCAEKEEGNNIPLELNENSAKESVTEVGTEIETESQSPNLNPEVTTTINNNDEDIKPETTETNTNKRDTSSIPPPADTSALPPPPLCSTAGLTPHETNCQAFYDCSSAESSDGSLRLITRFCAPNHAFNAEFGACGRDISTCTNPVACVAKGTLPDPSSNTSYYLCEPRLIGGGFHVFHVMCSENQIFYPTLGQCYLDFKNLNLQPLPGAYPPYFNWNQIEDIDLVKAELKVLKENDKLKLKVEEEKLKAERKMQKETAKEAKRLAKEQEKLMKEQLKQEGELFVCPQAGNYPSTLSDTSYISCTLKKTTLKKTIRKCMTGSKFDSVSGICVMDPNAPRVIEDEEDDD